MDAGKARRLVIGHTAGLTAVQVDAVVARMVAHDECVWHAAAAVTGRECYCSECRPDIRRFA